MSKQKTIHLTTFSTHNWKRLLLNVLDYLIWNFAQLIVTCHVHLCIVINHSISLDHCREHKPTSQIINNSWLKLKKVLSLQNAARTVNKKVKKKKKIHFYPLMWCLHSLFCCLYLFRKQSNKANQTHWRCTC